MYQLDTTQKTTNNPTLNDVLSRLENVKRSGNGYRAACPSCGSHKHNDSALIINETKQGRAWLHCFRCGDNSTRELSIANHKRLLDATMGGAVIRPNITQRLPKAQNSTLWNKRRDKHILVTYPFETVEGAKVEHVKFPPSDTYPKWSWRYRKGGQWHNGIGGNTPYLFGRKQIEAVDTVILCEGEKDATRGKIEFAGAGFKTGFAFTTHHAGAGARLKKHHIEQLKDKVVFIIGDNDPAGLKGARGKFKQLVNAGIDARLIALPILKSGGDLSDYFDQGGTVHDLLAMFGLVNSEASEDHQHGLFTTHEGHTCQQTGGAFMATVTANTTRIARVKSQKWRVCDACFADRVARFVNQILAEQRGGAVLHHATFDNPTWKKQRGAWQKQAKRKGSNSAEIRFQSFPLENGDLVIVNNQGKGETMPTDRLELTTLFNVWAMTPWGRLIGNSRNNFGREYKGTRGDSRAEREAEKAAEIEAVHKMVRELLSNFVPDSTQKEVANMSVSTIKKLLPLVSNKEAMSWLFYEYYASKKRLTLLKMLLDKLGGLTPSDKLRIQMFGFGREKVAKALNMSLNSKGAGQVKIDPTKAIEAIYGAAESVFTRGGLQMSDFLHNEKTEKKNMQEVGHTPILNLENQPPLIDYDQLE